MIFNNGSKKKSINVKCEISRNVKYLFYKNNAEKNGMFHMQKMLKGGNKHARIICDTCSKLSIREQKLRHIFSFWNNLNPRGVLIANF